MVRRDKHIASSALRFIRKAKGKAFGHWKPPFSISLGIIMVKRISLWRQSLVVVCMTLATPFLAHATATSDYPQKQPIRLIVAYPPGGSADLNGRLLGKAMSERMNQTVVVEKDR